MRDGALSDKGTVPLGAYTERQKVRVAECSTWSIRRYTLVHRRGIDIRRRRNGVQIHLVNRWSRVFRKCAWVVLRATVIGENGIHANGPYAERRQVVGARLVDRSIRRNPLVWRSRADTWRQIYLGELRGANPIWNGDNWMSLRAILRTAGVGANGIATSQIQRAEIAQRVR